MDEKLEIKKVIFYPDKALREISKSVEEITPEISNLVIAMEMTMYANKGIGLSAVQVGEPIRLFIIDARTNGGSIKDKALVFINPEVALCVEEQIGKEGCLSFPDVLTRMKSPAKVIVKATDLEGKEFELTVEGLMACVVSHEMDHLDGKLLIDRVKRLKREQIKRKLKRVKKYLIGMHPTKVGSFSKHAYPFRKD